MPEQIDLLDAIYTTRAIRKFQPEPVPLQLVYEVLQAATQAPSGRNGQPWRFVVVDDPERKKRIGELYREGYFGLRQGAALDENDPSVNLANHFEEAPVLIMVCGPEIQGTAVRGLTLPVHAGVYPAVQNLLLAARAYGLGGVLTLNHEPRMEELRQTFGIPEQMKVFAIVPLGYPAEKHGRKTRKPVSEVSYYNGWGNELPLD